MARLLTHVAKGVRNVLLLLAVATAIVSCSGSSRKVDVLIIGGGASGVAAGVQSSRMGVSTLIVEPTTWLGGMLTSAGVSAIDGNYRMPAGFFGEFRAKLAEHYGGLDSLKTGWVSNVLFEPSVGNRVLHELAEAEPGLMIEYKASPIDISRQSDGQWLVKFEREDGKTFRVTARVLIDGTELGDVAAAVGVGYDLGMDSRADTGEDIAPDSARNIIQDLTMVAILKDYGREMVMDEPEGYDPAEFACTCETGICPDPDDRSHNYSPEYMMTYGKLPNGKYMINWPFAGNDYYVNLVEMTPEERSEALEEAKAKTLRYVYFLKNQLGFNHLALADDEFPTHDHLPLMPYHRESRRIHGLARFTLSHITGPYDTPDPLYRTAVAVGDYPVDQHHLAYRGLDTLPKIGVHPIPSYGVPMGVVIPIDVDNLLVTEKSVSVTNIVNGSTRLQPVVTQIGQAAGAIAALAVRDNIKPSEVNVRDVQRAILDAGGYLMPFLDVEKDDPRFKSYQRIGAAGILRGEGRNVGWSNQTWLRADEPLLHGDIGDLATFYGINVTPAASDADLPMTYAEAVATVAEAAGTEVDADAVLARYGIAPKVASDAVTRGEFALIVDAVLDPFNARDVDIHGHYIEKK